MKKIFLICLFFSTVFAVDILTASKNGDYFWLVKKSQKRCKYDLFPIVTNGSLDNIKKLIKEDKKYAIVQGDVWSFFVKTADKESVKKIKFIKKFHHYIEAVYLIKNKSDKRFKDIKTLTKKDISNKVLKDIAVGAFGSGSSITGYNILTQMELNRYISYQKKEEALDALLNKDIFLIVYVAKFDKKDKKFAKWIDDILNRYGDYLELISLKDELKDRDVYQQIEYKENFHITTIPTYFISTDENITKVTEVYKCLDF